LRAVGQFARHHLAVDRVGDGKLPHGLDQPQIAHVGDVVRRDRGRLLITDQDRLDNAAHARFAQFVRQLIKMRDTALDQVLLRLLDHGRRDGLAAVAPHLSSRQVTS
jgi:hypothetical protein